MDDVQIFVDLNDDQAKRLQKLAESLSVAPGELARAAVNNLLTQPAEEFQRAVTYVLEKNRDLYERLS